MHVDIGQEVHLDGAQAGTLAVLAAAATDVEAETTGFVAADACRRQLGEEASDVVEEARVGGGVGAWRAADGTLVNLDDFVDILDAFDALIRQGGG